MKRTFVFFSVALLGAFLLSSCSEKSKVTIFDGELTWPSIMRGECWNATDNDGNVVFWAPHFQTEIGNSLRGLMVNIYTCEPGEYSGIYDAKTDKWSTDIIKTVYLTVDYDGKAYPTWKGQSATITIHSYDKKTKTIDATLEAIVVMEGSTNSRKILVDLQNYKIAK